MRAPLVLALLLAVAAPARAAPRPELGRLRALYLAAVGDAAAIDQGLAEIVALRAAAPPAERRRLETILGAYAGALTTLRAKHELWPPARLRHLRAGLRTLDAAVAAEPELAEVRYLRLMSCYYLPGVLGRRESVRADFEALARLLPHVRGDYPDDLYRAIARFVLEKGELAAGDRAALRAALERHDG